VGTRLLFTLSKPAGGISDGVLECR